MPRRKKPVLVNIDPALYMLARKYKFNLSMLLELAIARVLSQHYGIDITTPYLERVARELEKAETELREQSKG